MNVVAHNLPSMNANRQLNITDNRLGKSAEKLSSGYRINRAADDAAGLSISEKMRKQIRGLNQGCDNITDGISMAKTAEGALHEITDMLQRINVLSIQAYNDTNSRSDREAIQAEVDQLLTEFERVRETAKFNETYLLKGNPERTVLLEEAQPVTTYETKIENFDIPSWLGFDKELKVHPEYQLQQDPNKGHAEHQKSTTVGGQIVTENLYYGEYLGDTHTVTDRYGNTTVFEYAGPWTASIEDNYATKLSFEGLVSASPDADALYDNLSQLIGCSIGVPCATCSDVYYGINFLGTLEDGSSAEAERFYGRNVAASASLNLTKTSFDWQDGTTMNIFDKVRELMTTQASMQPEPTAEEKMQSTRPLSEEIAHKLRDAIYDKLNTEDAIGGHYDYVLKDGDYDLYVYDYRDEPKLDISASSSKTVLSGVQSRITTPVQSMTSPVYGEERGVILIQCSSDVNDRIPVQLPDISVDSLKLTDYSIARYTRTVETTYHDPLPMSAEQEQVQKIYENAKQAYDKEKAQYETDKRAWESDYRLTAEDPYTYKDTRRIWIPGVPIFVEKIVNGEKIPVVNPDAYRDEVRYYNGPFRSAPTPPVKPSFQPRGEEGWEYDAATGKFKEYRTTEKYDPSSVDLIGDALKTVTSWRSYLGAIQNRLEHTYNNNRNKEENTTAAESRIRDTDMAEEMVKYSTSSLLQNAGQTILSQANQQPQMVLQLLQ